MLFVERQRPKKGWESLPSVLRTISHAKKDRDHWLHDNLSRPGPDNRAAMSSKKRSVNRYKLPVCMSLRIAPGSTARIITITTVRRIELRDSETFISDID